MEVRLPTNTNNKDTELLKHSTTIVTNSTARGKEELDSKKQFSGTQK